jgi:hypothetical protein
MAKHNCCCCCVQAAAAAWLSHPPGSRRCAARLESMAYAETIARVSCRARRGTSVQQFVQWLMPCPPLWMEGKSLDPIRLCFKLSQHVCCCIVLIKPATPAKSSTQRGPICPYRLLPGSNIKHHDTSQNTSTKQTAGLITDYSNNGLGTAGVSWCGTTSLGLGLNTVLSQIPAHVLLPYGLDGSTLLIHALIPF